MGGSIALTYSTAFRRVLLLLACAMTVVAQGHGGFLKRRNLESLSSEGEVPPRGPSSSARALWSKKRSIFDWVVDLRRKEAELDAAEQSPPPPPPPPLYCGCSLCDESAWSLTNADGHSCGARITWLQQTYPSVYPLQSDACARVAVLEYPTVCSSCDPSLCQVEPSAPLFDVEPRDSYCGCPETCTSDVWESVSDSSLGVSCAAHVTWAQMHLGLGESAACLHVAENLPDSPCAQWCNPTTCNGNAAPPMDGSGTENGSNNDGVISSTLCGSECAATCTTAVLSSLVTSTTTCQSRIEWLRDTLNMAAQDACSQVAGVEYSTICGPYCDPAVCQGGSALVVEPAAAPSPVSSAPTLAPMDAPPTKVPVVAAAPMSTPAPVAAPQAPTSADTSNRGLGPNVQIFDPSMSTASIQGAFDDVFNRQVNNEMGSERYSMYFKPGTYGTPEEPLAILIGYYTEVAGLGASPLDVTIIGKIEVYNRCFQKDPYADGKFIPSDGTGLCFALNNFWRSLSNLSITIVQKPSVDACRRTAMFWAISQASSMRRVEIRGGDVSLMDYCTNPGFASGGFIADSKHVDGKIINGSQQQFCARNMLIAQWSDGVWNQVFLGVSGAPDDAAFPDPPFTTIPTTPVSREKPFLFLQNDLYFVRVPFAQTDSSGTSWAGGETAGVSLPLSDFFVATPSDSVSTINAALSDGSKHLLLTPGVYNVDTSIVVGRADTVVLGLGHATLLAVNGAIPLKTLNEPGIIISGVTFDAGLVESPVLLQIGDSESPSNEDPSNPTTLHDIYFRVGGPYAGKAAISLEINSNNVLIDHTWVWRADHGIEPFDLTDGFEGDNVRWREVIGRNGVVVNGDDVIATGLFVEHFQEYNVLWKGERGRVYFFQNELPYDPPAQSDWMASDGKFGWAGYKVDDAVTQHELYGGGVYCYNRNNPDIVTENGFEVPASSGIKMEHIYTRNLSGPGAVNAVINGIGNNVDIQNVGPEYVVSYP